jgi:hypothetical protein
MKGEKRRRVEIFSIRDGMKNKYNFRLGLPDDISQNGFMGWKSLGTNDKKNKKPYLPTEMVKRCRTYAFPNIPKCFPVKGNRSQFYCQLIHTQNICCITVPLCGISWHPCKQCLFHSADKYQ